MIWPIPVSFIVSESCHEQHLVWTFLFHWSLPPSSHRLGAVPILQPHMYSRGAYSDTLRKELAIVFWDYHFVHFFKGAGSRVSGRLIKAGLNFHVLRFLEGQKSWWKSNLIELITIINCRKTHLTNDWRWPSTKQGSFHMSWCERGRMGHTVLLVLSFCPWRFQECLSPVPCEISQEKRRYLVLHAFDLMSSPHRH